MIYRVTLIRQVKAEKQIFAIAFACSKVQNGTEMYQTNVFIELYSRN
jgi:hypothetical protein